MTAATPLPDLPADRDVTPMADGTVTPGSHDRLGATVTGDGADFAVFARRATGVELLLFDGVDDVAPARIVVLDPLRDRTGSYWHVHVAGIGHGQLYGYRVHGPWAPHDGLRFDATKVLLDPYGRAVATPAAYRRVGRYGDGYIPMATPLTEYPRILDVIRRSAEQRGRGDWRFDIGWMPGFAHLTGGSLEGMSQVNFQAPEALVERMRAAREIGINVFHIRFRGRSLADYLEQYDAFAEQVAPYVD